MDLLPTIAPLAGAELPAELVIDGADVREQLGGKPAGGTTPRSFLYYTSRGELAGIRRGAWKLLLESGELYQVEQDVSEVRDLAEKQPDLVLELQALALELDAEVSANARPTASTEQLLFDPARP